VAESSLCQSPGVATLSYPTLLYLATQVPPAAPPHLTPQVASGLRALEAAGLVHGDLATRNILVFPGHTVKISDLGAARPLYRWQEAADY
jgi:serine/threonine-protein kinase RIO1